MLTVSFKMDVAKSATQSFPSWCH